MTKYISEEKYVNNCLECSELGFYYLGGKKVNMCIMASGETVNGMNIVQVSDTDICEEFEQQSADYIKHEFGEEY